MAYHFNESEREVSMRLLISVAMGLALFAANVHANDELNRERKNYMERGEELPQTLVYRVNPKTNVAELLQLEEKIDVNAIDKEEIAQSEFQLLSAEDIVVADIPELDRDQPVESWYLYYGAGTVCCGVNAFFNPYFVYGAARYVFSPLVNYAYRGWNYLYYGWNRGVGFWW